MNWKKKMTSLILTVSLLVSMFPTASLAVNVPKDSKKDKNWNSTAFTDVEANSWYADAVEYVYSNGLMSGTSSTTFEPNIVMARAMVVQILYNKSGKPAMTESSSTFVDVARSDWYFTAVQWARENSYASGVGDNRFDPNAGVTREQFAQFMYNYSGKPEVFGDVLSQFPDGNSISWSKNAMTWAVSNKLINGSNEGGVDYLLPQSGATRAQAAIILKKYCELQEKQANFAILDLTVQGKKATAQIIASSACTLTIRFVDENTDAEFNTSATAFVRAGVEINEVTAEITGNMLPSHYKAIVTLSDSNGKKLCNQFTCMKYTTAQERFDAETIDDFADKKVINFDDDKTNNFGILTDSVKTLTTAEDTNAIEKTSDDTYVIRNIDSSVKALREGDEVLFHDKDGEDILISIGTIEISGTTATITWDDNAYLSDFYDVLKVDREKSIEQTEIDMSNADEGITLVGQSTRQHNAESENTRTDNKNISVTVPSLEFKLEFETDHVKVNGQFSISETLEYDIQYDKKLFGKDYVYYKVISTTENKVDVTAGLKSENNKFQEHQLDKVQKEIGEIPVPLGAGFSCKGALYFPLEVGLEGNLSKRATSTVKTGVIYCSESGRQNIAEKSISIELLNAEGKFEIKTGLKVKLSIEFLKDIVKTSFNVWIGPDITAEVDASVEATNASEIHACGVCLDGKVYLFGEITIDLTWKITEHVQDTIFDITLMKIEGDPLLEFYISLKNASDSPFEGKKKFGWGECPNKKYKTTIQVMDNENEVKNISVTVRNKAGDHVYIIDSGKSVYLYNGEYNASCAVNDKQVTQDFKVNGVASTIILKAASIIADGKCGDNLTWTLDSDGVLTISGTGDMWDYECGHEYEESKRPTWHVGDTFEEDYIGKQIKKIDIKDGVTSIGAYAFESDIATIITIPGSIQNIKKGAFDDCSRLNKIQVATNNQMYCSIDGVLFNKNKTILVQYPAGKDGTYSVMDGVTTIGSRAFAWSHDLKNVILPDSVNTIEDGAFWESGLTSITVGMGVSNIGRAAFSNLNLDNVYYRGSKEQWQDITIEEFNENLTSANIHYNS